MTKKYELAYAVSDARDLAACGCAVECAFTALTGSSELKWLTGTTEGRALEFLVAEITTRANKLHEHLCELHDVELKSQEAPAND